MLALRHAVRSLLSTPLVTGIAVLSLALGIGANTAIFSIVDALILKSLPVEHAERLSVMRTPFPDGGFRTSWTNPQWEQVREREALWDGAFAASFTRLNASAAGEVDNIDAGMVSGRYFEVLGVQPRLGRFFTADDDKRGGGVDGPVVVISHRLWRDRFGSAPDIVGRTFPLSNVNYTIIGVAPPGFVGHSVGVGMDAWVPLGTEPLLRGRDTSLDRRSTWWLAVFIRRQPGQSIEAATNVLRSVQPQIREATIPENWRPQDVPNYLREPFELSPAAAGISSLRNRYQRPLIALTVVVGLTLLIACGNIANLMLARAAARRHEWAVRTALGASRWRLAGQLLTENLILSLVGAALGLGVAMWASQIIVSQISTGALRVVLDIGLDWRMLGFTAGVAMLTTVLFGVGPAVVAAGTPPMEAMKEQGRGTTSGRQKIVSNTLVLAQVALSLTLLVGAGLFVRTFVGLADVDLGFRPQQALILTVNAQRTGAEPAARVQLYDAALAALAAVPGVTHAARSVVTPTSGSTWNNNVVIPNKPDLPVDQRVVDLNYVSPDFFATYGTALRRGRGFDSRDRIGTPRVAIVNEEFARKFFDGGDPVGQIVQQPDFRAGNNLDIEIVGVVENAVYRNPREDFGPTMYFPLAQDSTASSSTFFTVRAAGHELGALQPALTGALRSVHPDLSVQFRVLEEQVNATLAQERLIAMLSGFFGGLGVLLAAIGLYGITAYSVVRRRGEIGIRLALGSSPARVVRTILARTGIVVAAGLAAGGLASWWLSRFVSALLFGLEPTDPVTLAAAIGLLAVVSAIAGWLPARRAAAIDPAEALREG